MAKWYYRAHGADGEKGPVSLDSLLGLIRSGQLELHWLVRPSDSAKWIRVESLVSRLNQLRAKDKIGAIATASDGNDVSRPVKEQIVFDALGIDDAAPPAVEEGASVPPPYRIHRIETQRSYPAMQVMVWIYRVSAVLSLGLAVFWLLMSFGQGGSDALRLAFYLLAAAIVSAAIAEAIRVFIDIEANTRRSADTLEAIRAAVEYSATWQK